MDCGREADFDGAIDSNLTHLRPNDAVDLGAETNL